MLTLSACAAQQTQLKGVSTCSDDPEGTWTQKRAPADSAPVQKATLCTEYDSLAWNGSLLSCRGARTLMTRSEIAPARLTSF